MDQFKKLAENIKSTVKPLSDTAAFITQPFIDTASFVGKPLVNTATFIVKPLSDATLSITKPIANTIATAIKFPFNDTASTASNNAVRDKFAGYATAKLAAKQFKKNLQKTPLQEKADSIIQKQHDDEILRRSRVSRLTGLLFNEISDRIPSVLIPGIVKTVEMIESVETSVATHASMVEILIYWENYSSSILFTSCIIAAHVLSKLGFSFIWVLLLVYLGNKIYRRNQSRLRLKMKHDFNILSGLKMMDNDNESCEWLNTILSRYWSHYEAGLSETIQFSVNAVLESNKPAFLDDLRLSHFTLGSEAPRIESVKTYPRLADILMLDFELVFEPYDDADQSKKSKLYSSKKNSKIELVARIGKGVASIPIPILLTEVAFRGLMRLQLKFCTTFPHVEVVEVGFLTRPSINFILRPLKGLDLMDLPMLSTFLDDTINFALDTNIVNPVTIKIPILEMMGVGTSDPIVGVLVVNIFEGKNLKNMEITGKSDPYVKIMFGDKEVARTKSIESNLSPFWGEQKYVIVYKSMITDNMNGHDSMYFEVMDYNKLAKDKLMGTTSVLSFMKYVTLFHPETPPINELSQLEELTILNDWGSPMSEKEVWNKLHLTDSKSAGEIRSSIEYFPVPVTPLPISNSGILQITVSQAKDLAIHTKSSTYLQIELNNQIVARTPTKKRTNTPIWDFDYTIYLSDLESTRFKFTIKEEKDVGVSSVIGYTSINVKSAITNPSDWISLSGTKQGKLKLAFKCIHMDLDDLEFTDKNPIGIAKIMIKSGKSLMNVESFGKSDPYAVVTVEGRKIGRTHHLDNTLDPVWDDTFYAVIYSKSARLLVEVFDYNKLQADRKLGRSELYFDEILKENNNYGGSNEDITKRAVTLSEFVKDGLTITRVDTTSHVIVPLYVTGDTIDSESEIRKKSWKQRGHLNYSIDIFSVLHEDIIKAERTIRGSTEDRVVSIDGEAIVTNPSETLRFINIAQTLNLHSAGIMKIKIHEVKGLTKPMNIYVEFNMDDESEPALQTDILEKSKDLVWDESCDVFVKDVHSKTFSISVHESIDCITRNEYHVAEQSKLSPKDYIGRASFWISLDNSTIEVRLSCSFMPIELVMDDNERTENTGILQLTIIDGLDLEGVDSSGTSDPYCVILMNNEKVGKTKTHKKTNSPQFNETFYIPIKHRQRTNFVIQVFDYNNISRDLLLGTISIPLSNVSAGELLEGCYPIEGAPTGKLNIQILFEASTNREMSQVLGGKSTSVTYLPPIKTNSVESDLEFKSSLPELYAAKSLFSAEDLSKPTVTGSINVRIIAARGLKSVDSNGLSDPYIKVIQNTRGKIKTIYKTRVIKKSLDPDFKNEQFNSNLPPSFFRFQIKDYNTFQESKSMGETTWDVAMYCEENNHLEEGDYPFDLWLPIVLGGSGTLFFQVIDLKGEIHVIGTIKVGGNVLNRSRSISSISSLLRPSSRQMSIQSSIQQVPLPSIVEIKSPIVNDKSFIA